MSDFHIESIQEKDIDTVLAEDIDFEGELSFKKTLMIKGRFTGRIAAEGDLYVGERASIRAEVDAKIVSLKGRLDGDIRARARVELFATAVVEGNISSPDIVMESGCTFNGECTMRERRDETEQPNE